MVKKIGKCPHCNKEIVINLDNKADICPFCNKAYVVKEAFSEETIDTTTVTYQQEEKKESSKALVIIVAIFSIIFIIICSVIINQNNGKDDTKITERELKYSDFTYTKNSSLTSYTIYVEPNIDISEMTIELKAYGEDNKYYYGDTITKYDLFKGSTYAYVFEFGIELSLVIDHVNYNFSGKVSYF